MLTSDVLYAEIMVDTPYIKKPASMECIFVLSGSTMCPLEEESSHLLQ